MRRIFERIIDEMRKIQRDKMERSEDKYMLVVMQRARPERRSKPSSTARSKGLQRSPLDRRKTHVLGGVGGMTISTASSKPWRA